jgi:hypothetical protein
VLARAPRTNSRKLPSGKRSPPVGVDCRCSFVVFLETAEIDMICHLVAQNPCDRRAYADKDAKRSGFESGATLFQGVLR